MARQKGPHALIKGGGLFYINGVMGNATAYPFASPRSMAVCTQ
jgi:hypothetical protein